MVFRLEITYGEHDAMKTPGHLGRAISDIGRKLVIGSAHIDLKDKRIGANAGSIFDDNGNAVGFWKLVPAAATTDDRTQLTESLRAASIVGLLWDYLKRDQTHSDRRQTGWGTKTKQGLVACIERIAGIATSAVE